MKPYIKAYKILFVSAALFLLHQLFEPYIELNLIDSYLDDVLFLPISLSIVLIVLRTIYGNSFCLSKSIILQAIVITSISTELLFPFYSKKHIADWYDLVAYSIGAAIFYVLANKPLINFSEGN